MTANTTGHMTIHELFFGEFAHDDFIDLGWREPTDAEIEAEIERCMEAHANFVGPRQPLHFVSGDEVIPF